MRPPPQCRVPASQKSSVNLGGNTKLQLSMAKGEKIHCAKNEAQNIPSPPLPPPECILRFTKSLLLRLHAWCIGVSHWIDRPSQLHLLLYFLVVLGPHRSLAPMFGFSLSLEQAEI